MNEEKIIIHDTLDGRPDGDVAETTSQKGVSAASRRKTAQEATTSERQIDPYIWGIYIFMLIFSSIELFSASSSEVTGSNVYSPLIRHGIFLVLGVVIAYGFQSLKYVVFRRCAYGFALISAGLLIYSTFFGIEINGAQRAIRMLGFTIQPAEIIKLAIVLLLATILAKNQEPGGVSNKGVAIAATAVLVTAAITWKNGLTNTILLMGVSGAMFLIGGIQWRKLLVVMAVYGIFAGGLAVMKYGDDEQSKFDAVEQTALIPSDAQVSKLGSDRAQTHKGRLQRFKEGVHPDDPIDDYNRQVIFANFAQARGGLIGHGPGNSRESARLPLAFSDYIYSIIIEDTGFVGGVLLLLMYLLLLGRAGHIASRCTRAFPALLVMGCAVLIVLQAIAHMAIVVGIVPVSGQPLPFISKGGTSVLVMSAAIGMMLSVSRYGVTKGDKKKMSAELKELPEDMQAVNPTAIQ